MIRQDLLQTHMNLRSHGRLSGPVGKFDSSVCLRCGPQAADSFLSYGAKKMNLNLLYLLNYKSTTLVLSLVRLQIIIYTFLLK